MILMRSPGAHPSLARTYGYTAARRRALLQLIGLTDADHAHAARLHREVLAPDADRIVTDFYRKLGADREFRRIMARGFGIGHLRDAQHQYLLTLGIGFDTAAYVESRLRIGAAHARVQVPPSLYLAAYALLQRLILRRVRARLRAAPRRQAALIDFLVKIATLDMTLAIETYHNARVGELQTSIKTLRGRTAMLHRRAETDPFTGIAHHARLLAVLGRALARHPDRPLALLIADLDCFKAVNDTFGHLAGDKVLRAAAARIRGVARRGDAVGRYGGDEFMVVARDASLGTARRIAERLCVEIAANPIDIGGRAIHVTVSAGVAAAVRGDTVEALVTRADAALYAAKRAGRNRVVVAERTMRSALP